MIMTSLSSQITINSNHSEMVIKVTVTKSTEGIVIPAHYITLHLDDQRKKVDVIYF